MPYNGNGIFARIHTWANEAASGTPIQAGEFDEQEQDFATAFGNCITRDGQGGPTADIPWNNFGITGLRAPALAGDAANKAYVDTATSARSMGGYKLTNLADPTNPQDAATMAYVGGTTTQLPAQVGKAGQFLMTNGAIASWTYPQSAVRSPRTANTQLVKADVGTLIDITSGTFTQTFDTAANLGSGWYCYIRNSSGTGQVTIPASDGRTNWVMYPNECRLFMCDGAAFYSIVLSAYKLTAPISGNWIKPPGYNFHRLRGTGGGCGGGGGGGSTNGITATNANPGGGVGAGGNGGGGGAGGTPGATVEAIIPDAALPTSVPFTIGAGGVGGVGGAGGAAMASGLTSINPGQAGTAGTAGSPSSFGTAGTLYYVNAPAGGATANGGSAGVPGSAGAGANNTTATTLSATTYGAYSLPTAAPGAASSGQLGSSNASNGPGGPGGTGGPGGLSALTATAPAGAPGGASVSVLGAPGNNGTAAVTPTTPGAGGGGGGGGSGSTGCGTTANAASGKGGDGGRGADGAPGQFEFTGII